MNKDKKDKQPQRELGTGADGCSRFNGKLDKLCLMLEKIRFEEYIDQLNNPRKMFWKSFAAGIVRGFGMAVGFSILGALMLSLLTRLAADNIPLIGNFISEILKFINQGK